MCDWIKIKNEYVTTSISQRDLAEKHGVSYNTIKDRANKEKWADEKKEIHIKITSETHQKSIEEAVENNKFCVDFVKDNLIELTERCMQHEPVLDRQGNPTGEYRFDSSGANTALKTMAQILKMITEKIDIKSENTEIVLTPEERAEKIRIIKERLADL